MDSSHQNLNLAFSHLPKETHAAFKLLSQHAWLKEGKWYLAGGTALALQCDHRVSFDLDFFTPEKEFDADFIIRSLSQQGWQTTRRDEGTLYGELQGAKISFIAYPFFVPRQPFLVYEHIHLVDARDIMVMKIIAISQRCKKRDFFDLYWYVSHREPLLDIIKRVDEQFPNRNHNYHHIIKSLMYFEEAEEDPEPQVFFDASWEQVKFHFRSIVPEVAEKLL